MTPKYGEKTEQIVQLLAQNVSRRAIAERHGVSRQYVDRVARERAAEIAAKDSEPVSFHLNGKPVREGDDDDPFITSLNPLEAAAPQLLAKAKKTIARLDPISGAARLYFLALEVIERISEKDELDASRKVWEEIASALEFCDALGWKDFEGEGGREYFLQLMAKLKSVASDKKSKAGVKSKS